jgi:hypothetical protein
VHKARKKQAGHLVGLRLETVLRTEDDEWQAVGKNLREAKTEKKT